MDVINITTNIPKTNQFTYEILNGTVSGYFNIYQSKAGHIYITIGNRSTQLSFKQLNELRTDLYSLENFDHDTFMEAYEINNRNRKNNQ